jgi:hypothetical protein
MWPRTTPGRESRSYGGVGIMKEVMAGAALIPIYGRYLMLGFETSPPLIAT